MLGKDGREGRAAGEIKRGSPVHSLDRNGQRSPDSVAQACAGVHARLLARRTEIERAVLTRIYAVSDPTDVAEPEYVEGLRAAVSAALSYGLNAVTLGEKRSPPVPTALLAQARMAARSGVSLDTVLRRYFAGHTLLGDFVLQEAEDEGFVDGPVLQRMLRAQATLFDRLVLAVTDEYTRETESRLDSTAQRRAERVQRLLAGELLDTSELAYDFDASHRGAIAKGPGAVGAIRDLACSVDRRPLLIHRGEGIVWAWLGGRGRVDSAELERLISSSWPAQVALAIGEPGQGLPGWRLTHQQAKAAFPVALRRSPRSVSRYADVALLASMLQDDLLATSLRELYLAPLEGERDGGEVARETLRAYFAAGRNVSSAAAALGVSRRTVTNRFRAIESRLGCPLDAATTEIEAALRLQDLDVIPTTSGSRGG